jgi:hypothetical protein
MKKETQKIEIPFGAFDSELHKWEYTIPEGYEAEIKDGKVIVKKKDNEDEKIRKAIIRLLQDGGYMEPQDKEKAFAWLEKQKPIELPVVTNNKDAFCLDKLYVLIRDSELEESVKDFLKRFLSKHYGNSVQEWSKEDEEFLDCVEACVHACINTIGTVKKVRCIDWLRSLRPQPRWKPSEEQMMALQTAVADSLGEDYHNQLSLLEFNLRKRM